MEHAPLQEMKHVEKVERQYVGDAGKYYNIAGAMATCSSSPTCIPCSSSSSTESLAFKQSYLHTLIPALRSIHSSFSAHHEKLSAVKLAANASLALSVQGNRPWRQALMRDLIFSNIHQPNNSTSEAAARKKRTTSTVTVRPPVSTSGVRGVSHELRIQASRATFLKRYCPAAARRHQRLLWWKQHYPGKQRPASISGCRSYVKALRSSTRYVRCKKTCGLKTQKGRDQHQNRVSALCSSSDTISEGQVARLGGLVPGGQHMEVPMLLEEAAHYILALKMQVEALQFLSHSVCL